MKNKVKGVLIVVLIAIIGICLIKIFDKNVPADDTAVKDKGSYSYYYADPTLPTEESGGGINFYDK